MSTSFATSPDDIRIAYDVGGHGIPLVLLHGGGQTRLDWHTAGYVERLKYNFKVITIDIRGNGESEKPTESTAYSIEKHCQDILTVTRACRVEQFTIWGYSYGGNIGRYLAAQSTLVTRLIMMGVTFGPGASGKFRQFIIDFRDHWTPILQAQADGTLDVQALSQKDQVRLQSSDVPVTMAWLSAILDWRSVQPGEVRCPTLWLIGSRNDPSMTGAREYKEKLKDSKVQVQVVEGLNHDQEFTKIDKVLPVMLSFTQR
jgi:pimeloyl-ACP methyl ester carboxylesterase